MSTDRPASPADAERDAWLREALRHAPDAGAAPPRGLSDAILREARSATATAAPMLAAAAPAPARPAAARQRPWWQAAADFWAALGRGPMATGFAGVLAAVLVGLMWWEQPMDEALPRPPAPSVPIAAPTAAPPAAVAPVAPAAVPAPTPPAAPAPLLSEPRRMAQPRVADAASERQPAIAAKPSTQADEAAPSAFPASEKAKREQAEDGAARASQGNTAETRALSLRKGPARPSPPPPEATSRSADAETAAADVLRQRDKADASSSGKPTPAPAPSPAPAPAPAFAPPPLAPMAAAPVIAERKDARADTPAEPRSSLRAAPASVASPTAPPLASPAPGNGTRQRFAAAAPAQPLRGLLERLAAETPAWRWQASNGSETALDPAVREWLASIDAAASGWAIVEPALADQRVALGRVEEGSRNELRLLHDGQLAAVVRVDAGAVMLETRGDGPPRTWRAVLPADRAARLRASLPASPR